MASPVNYKVILFDTSGTRVAEFNNYVYLRFLHRVNTIGSLNITLLGDDPRIDLFELDGFIEVWRRNKDLGLDWYKEWEGLIRDKARFTQAAGERYFQADAYSYLHFLKRRTVAYRSETSYSQKVDVAETVMKEYVYENAGAGATNPPRIGDGVISGLTVQTDSLQGGAWAGDRSFKNLLQVLQEISLSVGYMDFDIVRTSGANFEFRTYYPQKGTDRTTAGLNPSTGLNGAGNPPLVFNIKTGSMYNPEYRISRNLEVNRVYVLGQGEKSNKIVIIRDNSTAIAESPWNQFEGSRNASGQEETNELESVGDASLVEGQARESLSFEALQQRSIYYGKQYVLGDLITAIYDDKVFNKKVTSVDITIQNTQDLVESIKLEFADV